MDEPIEIQIPTGLAIKTLMKALSVGNAYTWQVLWDDEIQYGKPKTNAMPELLLKGRILRIRREDIHHLEGLKRTLYLLNGGGSDG